MQDINGTSLQERCKTQCKYSIISIGILTLDTSITIGASGGVMVSKLDKQTYTSEFESHWVPISYGLVPNLSKKLCKFPYIDHYFKCEAF